MGISTYGATGPCQRRPYRCHAVCTHHTHTWDVSRARGTHGHAPADLCERFRDVSALGVKWRNTVVYRTREPPRGAHEGSQPPETTPRVPTTRRHRGIIDTRVPEAAVDVKAVTNRVLQRESHPSGRDRIGGAERPARSARRPRPRPRHHSTHTHPPHTCAPSGAVPGPQPAPKRPETDAKRPVHTVRKAASRRCADAPTAAPRARVQPACAPPPPAVLGRRRGSRRAHLPPPPGRLGSLRGRFGGGLLVGLTVGWEGGGEPGSGVRAVPRAERHGHAGQGVWQGHDAGGHECGGRNRPTDAMELLARLQIYA